MKKLAAILLFFGLFLLAACTSETQDELLTYINDDVKKLGQTEDKVVKKYDREREADHQDDEKFHAKLKDEIIPEYTALIDQAKAVKIKDPELKKIHEKYISAAETQNDAFETILKAIETEDEGLIDEANDKLATGRKGMKDYRTSLEKMADENDIKLEKE